MTSKEYFTSQVSDFISENGHKFYDAILVTSDKHEYGVNKVVLAVRSDFFKLLFKKDGTNRSFREKPLDKFILPSICHHDLETILHWIYHDEFLINDVDAVVDVLRAAEFLGLLDMSSMCQEWLINHMKADNALGIFKFAQENFLEVLRKNVWDFIMSHLPQVSAGEEWLEMEKDHIIEMIGSDDLQCPEEDVWEAAVIWMVQHHVDIDIIRKVRLGLLTIDFFRKEVVTHPLMAENPIIEEVNKYFNTLANLGDESSPLITPPFAVPRCPPSFLFVFGGWQEGRQVADISVYDSRADLWKRLDLKLPSSWSYMGSVSHDNVVYMIGGQWQHPDDDNPNRVILPRNLWRFDPNDMSLKKLSHMRQTRNYTCLVELHDDIYVLGGHSGDVDVVQPRHSSVEVYKVSRNQWYSVNPMITVRSDFGAAVLNNKIYCVGGFNGFRAISNVEVFSPDTGDWNLMPSMRMKRSGVKSVALRGFLVVVGGWDGEDRLDSCELYDPLVNTWIPFPSMKIPRSNHSLVVMDGKIIVMGGFEGNTTTDQVEIFDWEKWSWVSAGPLPARRSGMAAQVLQTNGLTAQVRETFRVEPRLDVLETKRIIARRGEGDPVIEAEEDIEDELPELQLVETCESESEEESESEVDSDVVDVDIEWYSTESSDEDEPDQNDGAHENELILNNVDKKHGILENGLEENKEGAYDKDLDINDDKESVDNLIEVNPENADEGEKN